MLMFEVDYPSDSVNSYPLLDTTMVKFLADSIGIDVDPRTYERMDKGYTFPLPVGYSSREVLGILAASYGGNFVISDEGNLLLIRLSDLPKENNYLIDQVGDVLVFGADVPGSESEFSGEIVTFDNPGGAEITSISVIVEPVQPGSGDPSPNNIRPISGWDSVNIWNKPTHDTSADPTVTIQLGQTVYGGTLDVTGGTMTVDRTIIDCASITTWTIDKNAKRIYKIMSELAPASVSAVVADGLICNRFKSITANQIYANVEGVAISTGSALQFRINGLTDNNDVTLADVNSYFAANSTNVVAKLATPIEIPLTPTQIAAIGGANNIWSNAGSIEATVQFSGGEAVKILV